MIDLFTPQLLQIDTPPIKNQVLTMEGEIKSISETHTGKTFDNIIMVYLKFDNGKEYDVLFTSNEDALPIAEINETVISLGCFYNKTFVKAMHEGTPCVVNVIVKK